MNKWTEAIFSKPTIVGSVSILTASYNIATISVSITPISAYLHLGSVQLTLLTSAIIIGAIFGAFFSGIFSDRFGRVGILTLDMLTFIVAGILSALVSNFTELFILRLIVGIGVGTDYVIIFTYMGEVDRDVRFKNVSMAAVMFFANFGILLSYAIGWLLLLKAGDMGWRYILASGAVFGAASIIVRIGMRESSLWKARRLGSFRGILSKMFHPSNNKRMFRFSAPWFLYQIGDQSLTLYLPVILIPYLAFSDAGGAFGSIFVKLFTIPASLVAVLLINRKGKVFLQRSGFLLRAIFLGSLGLILFTGLYSGPVLVIILLGLAFFFGAMGPDKTTVIMPAMNYPTEIRGTGQGFSETLGRIGGLFGVLVYGILITAGPGIGLIFLSATCFLGFAISMVPWHIGSLSKE
ncbi:MAG: MFS transporter [Thermoplasmataceae archaeon]|jgi:putative MFS transporter|nr:MFS transporter [Candidatus Thermoplasmatota archaeon]